VLELRLRLVQQPETQERLHLRHQALDFGPHGRVHEARVAFHGLVGIERLLGVHRLRLGRRHDLRGLFGDVAGRGGVVVVQEDGGLGLFVGVGLDQDLGVVLDVIDVVVEELHFGSVIVERQAVGRRLGLLHDGALGQARLGAGRATRARRRHDGSGGHFEQRGGVACLRWLLPERRLGLVVVRVQLQDLAQHALALGGALAVLIDARDLAVDADGLRVLPQHVERTRKQLERGHVLRVGLEADLQLAERALRVVALEVHLGDLARDCDVGPVKQQALGDLQIVVHAPLLTEQVGTSLELLRSLFRALHLAERLGVLDADGDVLGVELRHAAQRRDGLVQVSGARIVCGHLLVRGERVAHQVELLVHARELQLGVDAGGVQLQDLLVDRDGLQEEALVRVLRGDPAVRLHRAVACARLRVEVTDLEQRPHVPRIVVHEQLVLGDRLVVAPLRDEFLRVFKYFVAVDQVGSGRG
jgi:hypothetical protein